MTPRSLIGVPTAGGLTALALSAGGSPWLLALWVALGALVGGLVVFFGQRTAAVKVLQKLEGIGEAYGTVATELSILSGDIYQMRAEITSLRRAVGVPHEIPGTRPPPAPTSTEAPR